MLNFIIEWIGDNFLNLLLIFVTASAFAVYCFQKHDRKKEAARLIVIQINNLISDIRNISSRITGERLDHAAFYESVSLIEDDYWAKYKHIFVTGMSSQSINEIDKLFQYAKVIQDQQQVIVGLVKNRFFVVQQSLCNIESQLILNGIIDPQYASKADSAVNLLNACGMPPRDAEHENEIKKLFAQMWHGDPSMGDLQEIENRFSGQKALLEKVYNDVGYSDYIPVQARISLEKTIGQCALLEIKGTEGFKKLCKIAGID